MSIRSRFALAALVSACLAAGGLAAPPTANAASDTQIRSITIAVGDSTLVGAQLTSVTVRIRLTDPVGVLPESGAMYDRYWSCPCIVIRSVDQLGRPWKATPQAWGERLIPLRLGSGTAQDGVWVGSSMLGANDAGFWRPTLIHAGTLVQPPQPEGEIPDGFDFVPVAQDIQVASQTHVRGDDWPVLTVDIPTTITPYGTPFVISGSAITARTHRPVAGLRVLAMPNADLGLGPIGTAARTGPTGRWSLVSVSASAIWSAYWAPDRLEQPVSYVTARRAHVRAVILSRTVSATTVAAGGTIIVTGRMGPAGAPVVLQRYYAGAWRTVSRWSGYGAVYRLYVAPPRGSWRYRVVVVGDSRIFGAASPAFTLRAV